MSTVQGVAAPVPDWDGVLDEHSRELIERRGQKFGRRRGWLVRRALAAADAAGLTLAFVVSLVLFGGAQTGDAVAGPVEIVLFLATLPMWVVVANLYGLYRSDEERADHSTADDLVGVFHLVTVGSWMVFVVGHLTRAADPTLQRMVAFWVGSIVLVTTARAVARSLCRRTDAYQQTTVIVGAGDVGELLAGKLRNHPEYGLNVLGFVDSAPKNRGDGTNGARPNTLPVLGRLEHLANIVETLHVERVVIAFSKDSHVELLDLIRSLQGVDVQVDIVPRLFEVLGTNIDVHTAEGMPLIGLPPLRLPRSSILLKRTLDLALSLAALVVCAPLFALIALAIKLDSPGPVLFRQTRRGGSERVFRILKFRTMTVDADTLKHELDGLNKHNETGGDPRMFKIPNDPRVTPVGRLLRRYSLDELPQLFNVIRGEMSLVGPRPLILEEDQYVVDWRRRRLNLKPGITGLWQVLGRDNIPFEEMVKLDYLYVTTWSLLGDVKLILRTVPIFARAHDA